MEEHEVTFEDPKNIKAMELVCSEPEIGQDDPMPLDCMHAFQNLWDDDGVQGAIAKGHEYALHDNLE